MSVTVTLLVPDITDPFSMIAAGVGEAAEEPGLATTTALTGREASREVGLVRTLRRQRRRRRCPRALVTHPAP
jgi:LacI family transcriptional regulator